MELSNLRKQNNLSQNQIAAILNIKQATYSQYENGKREPSLNLLKQLKKIFNCSYDDLINALIYAQTQNATKKEK